MKTSRRALGFIRVALALTLGATVLFGRLVWEDSRAFVLLMFGLPRACAAVALVAEWLIPTRFAPVVVGLMAVVSIVWSL